MALNSVCGGEIPYTACTLANHFIHVFIFLHSGILGIHYGSSMVLCSGCILASNHSPCIQDYSKKKKSDPKTPNFQKPTGLCIKYTYYILCYEVLIYTHFLSNVLRYTWLSASILMQNLKGKILNFNTASRSSLCTDICITINI